MMGNELLFRAEDFAPREIARFFVETAADRAIIEQLKGRSSIVLQGSRGVGKSFLLKMAQYELDASFDSDSVLPVYLVFNKAGLLQSSDANQFKHWMLAKICNRIIRAAKQHGLIAAGSSVLSSLGSGADDEARGTRLEMLETAFEDSWRNAGSAVAVSEPIDPQDVKDSVEDLCSGVSLRRIVLLVDEAAHIFIPQQQRDFFTLMRDLRSPFLSVKAAVYPGVTAYGDSFQLTHDATMLSVDRQIFDEHYVPSMAEIVIKQAPELSEPIRRQGEVFAAIAFSASGNPRLLLKTLARSLPLTSTSASKTLREYYREAIWSEHSALGDRYSGHRQLVDWGRDFLERQVIPEQHRKNQQATETQLAIWVHRDVPASVKEALRLLCYSGILQEGGSGLRSTRSGTGQRYYLNCGCAVAIDGDPISYATRLRQTVSIKRWTEFGANNPVYRDIEGLDPETLSGAGSEVLDRLLTNSIETLDLTDFQKAKLRELDFRTVGSVLAATEQDFQTAKWVGPTRSRQMINAATAAVLEYLSG